MGEPAFTCLCADPGPVPSFRGASIGRLSGASGCVGWSPALRGVARQSRSGRYALWAVSAVALGGGGPEGIRISSSARTHAHSRTHSRTHTHTRTHARTHSRTHARTLTHTHNTRTHSTHVRAHTRTRARTHVRTHTCACAHTHTHTCTHAHSRTHTHAHARTHAHTRV